MKRTCFVRRKGARHRKIQRTEDGGYTHDMCTSFRPSFSHTKAREAIAELAAISFRDAASWANGMVDVAKRGVSYFGPRSHTDVHVAPQRAMKMRVQACTHKLHNRMTNEFVLFEQCCQLRACCIHIHPGSKLPQQHKWSHSQRRADVSNDEAKCETIIQGTMGS